MTKSMIMLAVAQPSANIGYPNGKSIRLDILAMIMPAWVVVKGPFF